MVLVQIRESNASILLGDNVAKVLRRKLLLEGGSTSIIGRLIHVGFILKFFNLFLINLGISCLSELQFRFSYVLLMVIVDTSRHNSLILHTFDMPGPTVILAIFAWSKHNVGQLGDDLELLSVKLNCFSIAIFVIQFIDCSLKHGHKLFKNSLDRIIHFLMLDRMKIVDVGFNVDFAPFIDSKLAWEPLVVV